MCSSPPPTPAPVTPAPAPAPAAPAPAETQVGAARQDANVAAAGTINGPSTRVDRSVTAGLGAAGGGSGLNI